MIHKRMLGERLLIGRDSSGKVFALKDVCPHQGVPLTEGQFNGKEIECCFHGWTFNTEGTCTGIPALCDNAKMNLCSIKTGSYICREEQGNVWVYFGKPTDPMPEIPCAPGLEGISYDQVTTTLIAPNHIDYNAVALIDTAHVPYVHNSWWWRSKRKTKEKVKIYVPSGSGWTMVKHKPQAITPVFTLIGDLIETEISFRLPCVRREYICANGRTIISGMTAITPIDENSCEFNHTTYWTIPYVAPLVTPIVHYFVSTFLGQDVAIARKQEAIVKDRPQLIMTIKDSGTPGRWYFDLKAEWAEATDTGRPFENPVQQSVLRWRT